MPKILFIQFLKIVQIQFPLQFFLGWHVGHILRSVDLCVAFRQDVTYEHVALVGTEQDADRWIVTFVHLLTGVVVDIHLHLANVLMGEIFCFEIDQDETFQNVVVKHEVDVEMAASDVEMFLTGDERKTSAKFKQKLLQMIDERLLNVGFIEMLILGQIEEFQHVGVFDNFFILWFWHGRLDLCGDALLILAGEHPLVVHGVDLALQLAHAPA